MVTNSRSITLRVLLLFPLDMWIEHQELIHSPRRVSGNLISLADASCLLQRISAYGITMTLSPAPMLASSMAHVDYPP